MGGFLLAWLLSSYPLIMTKVPHPFFLLSPKKKSSILEEELQAELWLSQSQDLDPAGDLLKTEANSFSPF